MDLEHWQKKWRMRRKKFSFTTMPDEVKGTVFQENQMGDHKLLKFFIFFVIFNLKGHGNEPDFPRFLH